MSGFVVLRHSPVQQKRNASQTPLGVVVTWYGKKRVLIPMVLLGTSLLAGCGPETADEGPAAAKKLAAAAAPAAAQNKGSQEAAAKAAAEKAAEAAAVAAAQKAAADKAAADKAAATAAQKAAADKAAADKAAADRAAADKAAAEKAAETAAAQNAAAAPVAAGARDYANCTELNADYPHGVGRPGAKDKTSGNPVTEFTVDQALYDANTESDRDNDEIACEKH